MAKKITFTMLVLLIVSAFVFVSCNAEAGKKPGPAPTPREAVVNDDGIHSENLIYNGDFELGADSDVTEDGSDLSWAEGAGIGNTGALLVFQNSPSEDPEEEHGGYGEVFMDLTKYYAPGKSYYIEASFKNVGGPESEGLAAPVAYIDFTVVSGANFAKYEKNYDTDFQYEGDLLESGKAKEIFDITVEGAEGTDISNGEWHTLSAIIDAETIDAMLVKQTDKNANGTEPTMHYFAVTLLVGKYPNQDGYRYYLDNVKVIDLNTEIPRVGQNDIEEPEEDD